MIRGFIKTAVRVVACVVNCIRHCVALAKRFSHKLVAMRGGVFFGCKPRCSLEYAVKMICAQADVLCQQFEAGRGFRAFYQATGGSDLLGGLFDERCLVRLSSFAWAASCRFRVF